MYNCNEGDIVKIDGLKNFVKTSSAQLALIFLALLLTEDLNFSRSMESYQSKFYLQKRYFVALMAFFGWIFMFLMRTNLSISIIDMTSERLVTVGNKTLIQVSKLSLFPI